MKMIEQHTCPTCGQSISYELGVDKGSCDILKKIAKVIGAKGINAVHPNKEMAKAGMLTARQLDNIVRLKFHGLVAHIDGEPGNYCLTNKAFEFLGGEPIPKTVVVMKRTKGKRAHVIAHSDEEITIDSLDIEWGPYWSSNGYQIKQGRVIMEPPVKGDDSRVTEI
jgi:hypothetical protein